MPQSKVQTGHMIQPISDVTLICMISGIILLNDTLKLKRYTLLEWANFFYF